jgi:hypothetical protein
MKARLCAFVLLAATASFQVFADEHKFGVETGQFCPKLPKSSGYMWEWVFSVDEGRCIGRVAKTRRQAFEFAITRLYGVGEIEPETSFVKSGSVGGTSVRWYTASRHRAPEKLEYRTFTLVDEKNQRYLAVSVYAESHEQMDERLSVLERTKYR